MKDKEGKQLNKILDSVLDLITIDELIAQGKNKGHVGYKYILDLKFARKRLKLQIRNYSSHLRWIFNEG